MDHFDKILKDLTYFRIFFVSKLSEVPVFCWSFVCSKPKDIDSRECLMMDEYLLDSLQENKGYYSFVGLFASLKNKNCSILEKQVSL